MARCNLCGRRLPLFRRRCPACAAAPPPAVTAVTPTTTDGAPGNALDTPQGRGLVAGGDVAGLARLLAYAHDVGYDWTDDVVACLTDTIPHGGVTELEERVDDTPARRVLLDGVARHLATRSPARAARDLDHLTYAPRFRAECARRIAERLAPPPPTAGEEELLMAIRARPDDDAPRHVYADWLQERSTAEERARGELISLQLELDDLAPGDPRGPALRARADKIVRDHEKLWSRWLGGPVLGWDRGIPLVEARQATRHPWLQGAVVAAPGAPIDRFSALALDETVARDVLASPALGPVAWLRIPASALIALPPRMETLRRLEVRGGIVNWLNGGAPTLAAVAAPALRTLLIEVEWPYQGGQPRADVATSFVRDLCAWPAMGGVRWLAVRGVHGLTTDQARDLCQATPGELGVDFAGTQVYIPELARRVGERVCHRPERGDVASWFRDRRRLRLEDGFEEELRPAPEARADVIAWLAAAGSTAALATAEVTDSAPGACPWCRAAPAVPATRGDARVRTCPCGAVALATAAGDRRAAADALIAHYGISPSSTLHDVYGGWAWLADFSIQRRDGPATTRTAWSWCLRRLPWETPPPGPMSDEQRLAWLIAQGEGAYDRMYDARRPRSEFRDARDSFDAAIELAARLGRADEADLLRARLEHIKGVYRHQFDDGGGPAPAASPAPPVDAARGPRVGAIACEGVLAEYVGGRPLGRFRIDDDAAAEITIGRLPDNSVQVVHRFMCKEQVRLVRTPDGFELEDLGSISPGTWVNGEHLPPGRRVPLFLGDEVVFQAAVVLRFERVARS